IRKPTKLGITTISDYPIADLIPYIDWTPFFMTWRLRGAYPKIFDDKEVGIEAKKLFNDAQELLKQIVDEKSLKARAVFGLFPANACEDDITLYAVNESMQEKNCEKHGKHFHTLQ